VDHYAPLPAHRHLTTFPSGGTDSSLLLFSDGICREDNQQLYKRYNWLVDLSVYKHPDFYLPWACTDLPVPDLSANKVAIRSIH